MRSDLVSGGFLAQAENFGGWGDVASTGVVSVARHPVCEHRAVHVLCRGGGGRKRERPPRHSGAPPATELIGVRIRTCTCKRGRSSQPELRRGGLTACENPVGEEGFMQRTRILPGMRVTERGLCVRETCEVKELTEFCFTRVPRRVTAVRAGSNRADVRSGLGGDCSRQSGHGQTPGRLIAIPRRNVPCVGGATASVVGVGAGGDALHPADVVREKSATSSSSTAAAGRRRSSRRWQVAVCFSDRAPP